MEQQHQRLPGRNEGDVLDIGSQDQRSSVPKRIWAFEKVRASIQEFLEPNEMVGLSTPFSTDALVGSLLSKMNLGWF